jgi:hypothetical protein
MKQVIEMDRLELDKEFTEEEIKDVIFQMEKSKAAGLDDFPIEFFQNCWDIIKDDMMKMSLILIITNFL